MKTTCLLLISFLAILFVSCEETDPIPVVPVTPEDPWTAKHVTNILIEDYTATWCGYCPRIHYAIKEVTEADSRIKAMAIYDDSDKRYAYSSQMLSRFGIQGFPTAKVNRSNDWSYPENMSGLQNYLAMSKPLGLAIETSVVGSTISINVKVEYVKTFTTNISLVVCLTEDKLVGAQANYYNDGRGNPIQNFEHNHVLRRASSDIFGDYINLTQAVKDAISSHSYTITSSSYNLQNCSIIAFVTDAAGQVINAQSVKVGENKGFEYKK
jgi:thiol-disulfide isomerase/thioredoxin